MNLAMARMANRNNAEYKVGAVANRMMPMLSLLPTLNAAHGTGAGQASAANQVVNSGLGFQAFWMLLFSGFLCSALGLLHFLRIVITLMLSPEICHPHTHISSTFWRLARTTRRHRLRLLALTVTAFAPNAKSTKWVLVKGLPRFMLSASRTALNKLDSLVHMASTFLRRTRIVLPLDQIFHTVGGA